MDENAKAESCSAPCPHPGFVNNMCISCGKPRFVCGLFSTIPFFYIQPSMCLTIDEIERRRDEDLKSLLSRKKLHLVLDLDETLIHATKLSPKKLNETASMAKVDDQGNSNNIYEIFDGYKAIKLRPGTHDFLDQVSSMFDLTIYTNATQDYAKEVARVLDYGKEGGSRFRSVISRENSTRQGRKGLDVVLSHERVILVVDDKEIPWSAHKENLIQIPQYTYFPTGKCIDHDTLMTMNSRSDKCEEAMDGDLVRVLSTLRAVHRLFYDGEGDCQSKDVRQLLKRVVMKVDSNELASSCRLEILNSMQNLKLGECNQLIR